MKIGRILAQFGFALLLWGCTETRVKKYQELLEPRLLKGTRPEIDAVLGAPTRCRQEGRYLKCEYHTAHGRNTPVSSVYAKAPGFGPDLTPLDQFDVLHLFYDGFGVLQEWQPITVTPP